MSRYLGIIEATPEFYKGCMENPQDRKEVLKPMFDAFGGSLDEYWFGVGENNIYVVLQFPDDDVSVEALSMAICASGILSKSRLVPIMTSGEAVASMKKAREIAYNPPSGD